MKNLEGVDTLMDMKWDIQIPTTVENMGKLLKAACDDYIDSVRSTEEFESTLLYLKNMREDLFNAAVTDRWVGKKRKKLIECIMSQAGNPGIDNSVVNYLSDSFYEFCLQFDSLSSEQKKKCLLQANELCSIQMRRFYDCFNNYIQSN